MTMIIDSEKVFGNNFLWRWRISGIVMRSSCRKSSDLF